MREHLQIRLTSAYPLFLPRQDSRSIDDTDALQDRVWHLGTHEPAEEMESREGERESKSEGDRERKDSKYGK